ncbi:MAG: DUF1573 domain-containing protein [bacterium]|nr:DUF1573 domain-containing protein [bacterium]
MEEKNNRNNLLALAIFASTVFIGVVILIAVNKIVGTKTEAVSSQNTIEKNGEVYEVVEGDNPITLTIITDKTCEACGAEKIETWLKSQVGASLAVQRLDYSTDKGKEMFEKYEGKYFPFLLLGSEIKSLGNFAHLTHHTVTQVQDRYLVDLEKIGADIGKYVGVASYEKNDPLAPIIKLVDSSYDFGEVKLSGGKVSKSFKIKNEGQNPLVFLGLSPSCGCTSAKVVTVGGESPEYQMAGHGGSVEWRGELAPGEEGEIIVSYDPAVHPELNGDVTRTVDIKTNDPNNPKSTIRIMVKQIPN